MFQYPLRIKDFFQAGQKKKRKKKIAVVNKSKERLVRTRSQCVKSLINATESESIAQNVHT